MKNPYDDILPPEAINIGRGAAWCIALVFLLGILLPPLLRNVSEAEKPGREGWVPVVEFAATLKPAAGTDQPGVASRLRAFETKLQEEAGFGKVLRRSTQAALTQSMREGNSRTIIARDGWLYFRPAIQALTGYGPITPEPQSVAKDPSRQQWKPALQAIVRFAEQLRERGIELVLVPAPVKPMLYPEHLTGELASAPLRHRDSGAFFDSIRAAGVEVIDVTDRLWELKVSEAADGPVFLKQDTHWQPRGMVAAAETVATHLKSRPWFAELPPSESTFRQGEVTASHIGDLVEKLDLPAPEDAFSLETVTLNPIIDDATGLPIATDSTSAITVLGDSFVNIFDDPALGFSSGDGKPVGAGFAQHLAANINRQVDVIAVNGEASSGVRERFARRYDDEVRSKKVVVWVIAARDLFLSETPAASLVRWDDVVFNTRESPVGNALATTSDTVTVTGTITMKSAIKNPNDVAYPEALFIVDLTVEEIVEGRLPEDRDADGPLSIVLWAFQNRVYSEDSKLNLGQRITVKIVPWKTKSELQRRNVFNDSDSFDPPWFAEDVVVE